MSQPPNRIVSLLWQHKKHYKPLLVKVWAVDGTAPQNAELENNSSTIMYIWYGRCMLTALFSPSYKPSVRLLPPMHGGLSVYGE